LFIVTLAVLFLLSAAGCATSETNSGEVDSAQTSIVSARKQSTPQSKIVFNNGGNYVKFNGVTYFRGYSAEDRDEAIKNRDKQSDDTDKYRMMCIDDAGKVAELFYDVSSGGIFIDTDNNFYLSRTDREFDNAGNLAKSQDYVYSLTHEGKLRWKMKNRSILALDESRNILIADSLYSDSICVVNCNTGERDALSVKTL
jgi:hypothetical protein